MFEAISIHDTENGICVTNISEYESSPEEIDRVLSNIEITDNFAFYDSMELLEV